MLVLARDESIRTNFRQYGLEGLFVDVMISDAARQVLRPQPLFDAIVTDREYKVVIWIIWSTSDYSVGPICDVMHFSIMPMFCFAFLCVLYIFALTSSLMVGLFPSWYDLLSILKMYLLISCIIYSFVVFLCFSSVWRARRCSQAWGDKLHCSRSEVRLSSMQQMEVRSITQHATCGVIIPSMKQYEVRFPHCSRSEVRKIIQHATDVRCERERDYPACNRCEVRSITQHATCGAIIPSMKQYEVRFPHCSRSEVRLYI